MLICVAGDIHGARCAGPRTFRTASAGSWFRMRWSILCTRGAHTSPVTLFGAPDSRGLFALIALQKPVAHVRKEPRW
jgi:hypothetical protein